MVLTSDHDDQPMPFHLASTYKRFSTSPAFVFQIFLILEPFLANLRNFDEQKLNDSNHNGNFQYPPVPTLPHHKRRLSIQISGSRFRENLRLRFDGSTGHLYVPLVGLGFGLSGRRGI